MTYLGDFAEDYTTLNFGFTTRNVQGAGSPPFALASGVISVYAGSSTTQSTAGITLAANFDGVTGLNTVLIDLSSDAFYATGADYKVVITTGTVNSISVVGEVVAHFSIENRHTAAIVNDWTNGGRLDTLLDAIPTTAMRGTDSAALASVVGALDDGAAAGDPTTGDTVMQYTKQLINLLAGAAGIVANPSEQAPGNGINIFEILNAIHTDVTGLAGSAMRGTDSAMLAANGALEATVAALNDISTANVLTQINAALDTAISELSQGVPTTTPTVRTALMLMYMAMTNKFDVQTSGTDAIEIHNAAGTRIAQKLITDDGSDYSAAKMISGA